MKNVIKITIFLGSILFCIAFSFYCLRLDNKRIVFENNKYILSKVNDLKYEKKHIDNIYENSKDKKSIHVLVIGESAYRNHHGIYGYNRNTTPYLSSIKNEIIAFTDVISSTPRTNTSLRKALTLSNNDKVDANDFSIVQMMNSAGYETFWVSNQKPIEQIKGNIDKTNKNNYTNKIITTISNASDYKYYNFYNSSDNKIEEDEALLSILENILLKENEKKFIIIHLAGSHKPYASKYPSSFSKTFDIIPNYKFLDEKEKVDLVNDYDVSIAYTDHVLSKIINSLKSYNGSYNSTLTYFSDHGEELYQNADFIGHSNRFITKNMFKIPFFIWSNNSSFITSNKIDYTRKYISEDLIYTLSDLYNISFPGYDSVKSIINDSFIFKPRIINFGEKSKNFDTKW